ncbi:MAG: amidohydrolase [Granulosicoccus sp.]
MKHIDAHQHFWRPSRGDYVWMPDDDPILTRPYTPGNLVQALNATSVEQTILVQAAPSVAESEYLLGIADATEHVAKVVGWVDFEDPLQRDTLKRLAAHPKFAGVRPMIQDLPDDNWMLRDDVQWAYQALVELDLTFDCLGFPRHLDNFLTLLKRYPEMRAVIDHCMKPQFRAHSDAAFALWARGITQLANSTRAFCKLSGLVTEADSDWSVAVLKPYTDHIIAAFGAQRVMWGSDWPVVRLRCEYEQWFELAKQLTTDLSDAEREQIFSGTARKFYRLR